MTITRAPLGDIGTGGSLPPNEDNFIVGSGTIWESVTNSAARIALALSSTDAVSFASLTLSSNLTAAGAALSGSITAADITVTGNATAVDGIFSGDVSAVGGTFTGNISAVDGTFTGDVGVTGAVTAASATVTALYAGETDLEGNNVNVNGVTYSAQAKITDINDSHPAQLVIHRHSTTSPAVILGTRSDSTTTSHTAVSAGQICLSVLAAGWTGTHYDLIGSLDFRIGTGSVSSTSSPGKFVLAVTPDASNTPATALTIDSDKSAVFAGAVSAASLALTTDLPITEGGTGASTAAGARTNLGVGTGDSPEFTALNVGHASDTTITRTGAGTIAVEGNVIYRAGGTDVPVADGGTGASDAATARTNLGVGTGDSPQFTAVNVGAATDTTLARSAAGVLTVEGNTIFSQNIKPMCQATRSGSQAVSATTWTKVNLNNQVYSQPTDFFDETTNYRATPAVAGYYLVNGTFSLQSLSTGVAQIAIYVNGSIWYSTYVYIAATSVLHGGHVSGIVQCNGSTDYIELYIYLPATGAVGSSGTSITVHRIY